MRRGWRRDARNMRQRIVCAAANAEEYAVKAEAQYAEARVVLQTGWSMLRRELAANGWASGVPHPDCEQDRDLVESEPCAACGGVMQFKPFIHPSAAPANGRPQEHTGASSIGHLPSARIQRAATLMNCSARDREWGGNGRRGGAAMSRRSYWQAQADALWLDYCRANYEVNTLPHNAPAWERAAAWRKRDAAIEALRRAEARAEANAEDRAEASSSEPGEE